MRTASAEKGMDSFAAARAMLVLRTLCRRHRRSVTWVILYPLSCLSALIRSHPTGSLGAHAEGGQSLGGRIVCHCLEATDRSFDLLQEQGDGERLLHHRDRCSCEQLEQLGRE